MNRLTNVAVAGAVLAAPFGVLAAEYPPKSPPNEAKLAKGYKKLEKGKKVLIDIDGEWADAVCALNADLSDKYEDDELVAVTGCLAKVTTDHFTGKDEKPEAKKKAEAAYNDAKKEAQTNMYNFFSFSPRPSALHIH